MVHRGHLRTDVRRDSHRFVGRKAMGHLALDDDADHVTDAGIAL